MRIERGFTLVEVAVVVLIITLLLGSLLVPLATQVEQRNIAVTQKSLDDIREALFGFAMANGRLPCPESNLTSPDGTEKVRQAGDAATDGCAGGVYDGFIPWATLGVQQADAWGNRFKYRVSNGFTRANGDATAASCSSTANDPNTCTVQMGDVGNLTVTDRVPLTKAEVNLATQVAAVVVSFGKNGYGATSQNGTAQQLPPPNTDEFRNASPGVIKFYARPNFGPSSSCDDSSGTTPFCEFDDKVMWLPTGILLNRMVTAGRLP